MSYKELGRVMMDTPVDATLMDACLASQLEALTHMAPWAGLVLASVHPIKARGFELDRLLSPENLSEPDLTKAMVATAREARSTTPSFAVIDAKRLQERLLPCLQARTSQPGRGFFARPPPGR